MSIETNEGPTLLAKGSDGKAHDIHKIVTPAEGGAPERTEWFLSTGIKLTTEDGVTFTAPGEDLVLTKAGKPSPDE